MGPSETKVARAGARNYPRRRQRKRSRRGAKLSPSETNTALAPLRGDASSAPFGGTCLPAGRSVRGSDRPPACHSTLRTPQGEGLRECATRGEGLGVRRQERKISAVAEASGRVSLRAGERRHSPFIRQRRQKAMPARIRRKSQLSIAREGFLDRRSKWCFWLLLSPQTKVARAGARNYPRRRQILRLRRCAAAPYPPPSGAPVSLRVGPRV